MSKDISLTFSISTRHTNKKIAQTRLHHRHNTQFLRRHSNNILVLVRNMLCHNRHPNKFFVNNSKRFQPQTQQPIPKYPTSKNTPFQNLQKQPEAFQQSQPQPRFKEPQTQPLKDNRRGKRVAKRAMVDLVDDEEEEEQTRQCARWTRDEEILLTQCWIETSENGQIKADRTEDSFGDILWMISTVVQLKVIVPDICLRKPLDKEDHTDIFGPDVRPRPAGKTRPAKKTKSETMESSGQSALGSISDSVSEDLRRKLQARTSAYEAKKQNEIAIVEFKEMEFLTIHPDTLPEPKASIFRKKKK
nr:hypothetical protein [Tanacetum cinerariifolium]GEZ86928.1 hypothetical protein [Tanacetum cinerariifolium]GEZ91219.1 hypothetical protein [Tanacetum cinerariifolium]